MKLAAKALLAFQAGERAGEDPSRLARLGATIAADFMWCVRTMIVQPKK